MMAGVRLRLLLLLATALTAVPATAQIPPDARWRTFDTEHFRVTFAVGLEPTARRAADRAERAYAVLADDLVDPPRGVIDLVITDNIDLSNGYATPIPTNRVVIYAHPPISEPSLAYYDDWLNVVILHELVHIFHLDAAEGVLEGLRSVFGRSPVLFPHLLSPGWLVEGLATAYESRLTTAGRVRGTTYEMMLRTAVLEDELFTIDRASADPIRWPAGTTRYLYGAFFVDHLARRYGTARVARFIEEYGGRLVPYRLNSAARETFGQTLVTAWGEWSDSLRVRYVALADSVGGAGLTRPTMLTTHGRAAFHPRFSPAGDAIAYSAASGREEPALRVIGLDGAELWSEPITHPGPAAWLPDGSGVLTSRLDHVDAYRIHSDLRVLRPRRAAERVTRDARVWEPDLHPDGRTAVVVTDAGGTNALAIHDLVTGTTRTITTPDLDVHWAWPRWSPDGEMIAATRWSAGGLYDVVLLDAAGAVVRELTSDRAVDAAPAWSPDGRYVLFSSDRTGISNIHALDVGTGELWQVTNVLTGAIHPDVSPDGRRLAFALYGPEGWDLGLLELDPESWRPAAPVRPEAAGPASAIDAAATAGGPARVYSPFPTVLPAAWSLTLAGGTDLGPGVGAAARGQDLVGRHEWAVATTVFPRDWRTAAGAAYRFSGLGMPVLDAFAAQSWDVAVAEGGLMVGDRVIDSAVLERERKLGGGVGWVRPRWRSATWVEARAELNDLDLVWQHPDAADGVELIDFPQEIGASLGGGYTSARSYGLAFGPQDGITLGGTIEAHQYLRPLPDDSERRGYARLTGRGRGYAGLDLPGFARHVIAVRTDGGAERGSLSPGFAIGGAGGELAPAALGLDVVGGGLRFPVRGYPAGVQHGNRAVVAGAEYRFPLALVERGIGLVPISLGRVWGDVFADAGTAWCGGSDLCETRIGGVPSPDPLYSAGAELVAHLRFGFVGEIPLRLGAVVPLRGDPYDYGPSIYLRVGRSF